MTNSDGSCSWPRRPRRPTRIVGTANVLLCETPRPSAIDAYVFYQYFAKQCPACSYRWAHYVKQCSKCGAELAETRRFSPVPV